MYLRSSNMNFSYSLHHFNPHGKISTRLIDLDPNVWSVHRSVGKYRTGLRHRLDFCVCRMGEMTHVWHERVHAARIFAYVARGK